MKPNTYMTRALQSNDPRFARVLARLGYGEEPKTGKAKTKEPQEDDLAALRAEYKAKKGKRPFNGWDADKLRAKLAE